MNFIIHKQLTYFLLILLFFISQNNKAQISEKTLKKHVKKLSSKNFEGRGIRTDGIKLAENYILSQVNILNLNPINNVYRQEFSLNSQKMLRPDTCLLILKNDTLHYGKDYYTLNQNTNKTYQLPLYHYQQTNNNKILTDHAILINHINQLNKIKSPQTKAIFVKQESSIEFEKLTNTNGSGINNDLNSPLLTKQNIKTYYLSPSTSKLIDESLKTDSLLVTAVVSEENTTINPANILAQIKGTKGDSTIIISAHYDHIGIRYGKINPGANDNASGVAALLEIAKQLSQSQTRPKHNILFAFFSAEESGLLGSRYFVSNPPHPLNKTIANINLDMIGNTDPMHKKDPNYIYAYGPEKTSYFLMHKIDSINNKHFFLNIDHYKHDKTMAQKFLRMSDQANFIKHNIPALFIFNGLSPNYHTPKDTYNKLDYKKIKNVCELTIELIKDLAY
ncbi:M28 family metallopeptidase [Plebeiibacterium marinum]|uniref:M20/M25/M40 family metallo-hydrolase n=1 Tax=Plebeiibacterium marinum TaxID=2992111 RepID=A0AAE3MBE0_9BACT|nr:M20/M25/M40 family metallo-hydrolase [Plebeiobacterium marinum]MCW3804449.1 M20/M25/M40 family metallo-hydrolase [Plebeiobacterium marinum]